LVFSQQNSRQLDYAGFQEELDRLEDERQRAEFAALKRALWYQRPEIYAIALGVLSLLHALYVQWIWPLLQKKYD
jgi:hypothetical protein